MIPQAVEAAVSRVISPDELRVALESTIPPEEREQVLELVRWFTTRYASSGARLAYVRQAVARWQRARTKNIS
jgi:hypothetical protein